MKPRLRCRAMGDTIGALHDTGFEGDFLFYDFSGKRDPVIGIDNDNGEINQHRLPRETPYATVVEMFVEAIAR